MGLVEAVAGVRGGDDVGDRLHAGKGEGWLGGLIGRAEWKRENDREQQQVSSAWLSPHTPSSHKNTQKNTQKTQKNNHPS